MNVNTKPSKIPTEIIIASFRGELSDSQRVELDSWLSLEGSKDRKSVV